MINYNINHDKFSIYTQDNCYYGGFLMADGSSTGKNSFALYINQKDESLMKDFANFLEIPLDRLRYQQITQKSGFVSDIVSLTVPSKKLVADLSKFGVTKNKTYTPTIPLIPNEFFPAFLTGLIDGDGCITQRPVKSGKVRISTVCITGNKIILKWLEEHLALNFSIKGVIRPSPRENDVWSHILFTGENRDKLLNLCLKGYNGPRLERKWAKVPDHLNNQSNIMPSRKMEKYVLDKYMEGKTMRCIIDENPLLPERIGEKKIRSILKRNGIKARSFAESRAIYIQGLDDKETELVALIVKLYSENKGYQTIEKEIGIDQKKVKRLLLKAGVTPRTRSEAQVSVRISKKRTV